MPFQLLAQFHFSLSISRETYKLENLWEVCSDSLVKILHVFRNNFLDLYFNRKLLRIVTVIRLYPRNPQETHS